MQKQIDQRIGFVIIGAAAALFFITVLVGFRGQNPASLSVKQEPTGLKEQFTPFSSVADFKQYLAKTQSGGGFNAVLGRGGGISDMAVETVGKANLSATSAQAPARVSETNVQVLGIDEPDIVKTDGKQIFYSQPQRFYPVMEPRTFAPRPDVESSIMPPRDQDLGKIKIINALPPEEVEVAANIDKSGDLLLSGSILIVFSQNKHKIYGYNVSDPQNPQEKWSIELKDNSDLIGARLVGDTVYLASRDFIRLDNPCPIEPFIIGGAPLKVTCKDIYHPVTPVPTDITYNLLSFNAHSGSVKEKASFTGYMSNSVLYISQNSIYLTYEYPGNMIKLMADFLEQNPGLFPAETVDKIRKLEAYDISESAKYAELNDVLDRYTRGLSDDDLMKMQNEINNRMDSFTKNYSREMQNTGIVKVKIPNLQIAATGKVPGGPLNQFSLDEYKGNLRIATTTSGNWSLGLGFGFSGRDTSTSDVYILDDLLNQSGKVVDLGVGERIYSVRFIEDKGYVVTFKQVDPF